MRVQARLTDAKDSNESNHQTDCQIGLFVSIKEIIVRAGSMNLAMPEIERLGLPEDQIVLVREINDALRSIMSERAKRRGGFARLPSESAAIIQRGLDEGLHHSDIARLAKTTRTTVWRHARRKQIIADE